MKKYYIVTIRVNTRLVSSFPFYCWGSCCS